MKTKQIILYPKNKVSSRILIPGAESLTVALIQAIEIVEVETPCNNNNNNNDNNNDNNNNDDGGSHNERQH